MSQALKSSSLVVTSTCPVTAAKAPLFKYTVTHPEMDMDSFFSDKWSAVVDFLLEDQKFNKMAVDECTDALGPKYKEWEFDAYVYQEAERLAVECGYSVVMVKEMKR